ncbi:hypothetical protein BCR41DRAFT_129223 [Lobosporangium transversale]|uniref:Transcription elongation factor Eaf N-terminal domain-containing protein n=1 Tax=Lobosporangium transversale TaxID=64571 RepID=A0A1Y2GH29_9FUNG|nr:hypothetical protein BCR41DRAFT_129223 [Lobosporangium transversale]ORZ10686.1 hypothetical protein BCR41DRAFT_129223 [Lobosporangium transversale]|eukprot:XP_021879407.1 hypothetical protein BCR41DRAFT_129223 [Lobosporangium transversale]
MVGWNPKGVYTVHRGASLSNRNGDGNSNEFFQFKYNFTPESVDKSKPGVLIGNGEGFELEFAGNNGGGNGAGGGPNADHTTVNGVGSVGSETIAWTSPAERPGRAVDCLLIFDEETQVKKEKIKIYIFICGLIFWR